MRRVLGLVALTLALAAPASAAPPPESQGAEQIVTMPGRFFAPGNVALLVGESVRWRNADSVTHLIEADDESFRSPRIESGGEFVRRFDSPGAVPYRCTLHSFMRGRLEVASIVLTGPTGPLEPGQTAKLEGKAPPGTEEVVLERFQSGGPASVARAQPDAAGAFSFTVTADTPARYRVRAGELSSLAFTLHVAPKVTLTARRTGRSISLALEVTPAQPGALLRLERFERERFGFVPFRSVRLGADSRAALRLRSTRRMTLRARLSKPVGGYSVAVSPRAVVGGASRRHDRH